MHLPILVIDSNVIIALSCVLTLFSYDTVIKIISKAMLSSIPSSHNYNWALSAGLSCLYSHLILLHVSHYRLGVDITIIIIIIIKKLVLPLFKDFKPELSSFLACRERKDKLKKMGASGHGGRCMGESTNSYNP